MARKYLWAFDSFDDAVNAIVIRMIAAIDRGNEKDVINPIAWYSFIAKKEAASLAWSSRANDNTVADDDFDVPISFDQNAAIDVKNALYLIGDKYARLVLGFHGGGFSVDELGTTRSSLSRARDAFRRAYESGNPMGLSGNGDATVYGFVHNDGRKFEGTRVDFCSRYGITPQGAHKIVSGKQKTHKGWSLME